MLEQYVKKILTSRVYDVAVETPLQAANQLTERLGNQILLKREDLQPVYSFKIRGAYNKLMHLTDAERACGVVTASAGNHAQGLALAVQRLFELPQDARRMGQAGLKVMQLNQGALQRLLDGLGRLLSR